MYVIHTYTRRKNELLKVNHGSIDIDHLGCVVCMWNVDENLECESIKYVLRTILRTKYEQRKQSRKEAFGVIIIIHTTCTHDRRGKSTGVDHSSHSLTLITVGGIYQRRPVRVFSSFFRLYLSLSFSSIVPRGPRKRDLPLLPHSFHTLPGTPKPITT